MPNRPRKILVLIVTGLVTLFAESNIALAQSDGVKLSWKFTEGQKYNVDMIQKMGVEMNLGGNPVKTQTSNNSYMTWNVTEMKADGGAIVNTTIDRMTLSVEGPMGNVQFDSNDEEDAAGQAEQMAKMLRPMIGVQMSQTMQENGEITEVNIPDAVKTVMQAAGPNGADMLGTMSKNATLQFPDKPLQIGDSWSKTIETKSPAGKMTIDNTYTYQGLGMEDTRPLHQFDVEMKMAFAEGTGPAGSTITILNQDTDGKLFFDAEKGRIDHSSVKQNVQMNISVAGQNLQQTLTQDIQMHFRDSVESASALK